MKALVLLLLLAGCAAVPERHKAEPKKYSVMTARLTGYWQTPYQDKWTYRLQSSTGMKLRYGVVAVDPKDIPYGSRVEIPGLGSFIAGDTGSAVKSDRAARKLGQKVDTTIDVFFMTRSEAVKKLSKLPMVVKVKVYHD